MTSHSNFGPQSHNSMDVEDGELDEGEIRDDDGLHGNTISMQRQDGKRGRDMALHDPRLWQNDGGYEQGASIAKKQRSCDTRWINTSVAGANADHGFLVVAPAVNLLNGQPSKPRKPRGGRRRANKNKDVPSVPKPICVDFTNGRCTRGPACRFLHDPATIKPPPPPPRPKLVCMFFKQGKCNRSTCGFSHDLTLLKREPCVFHHLFKGCKKGAEACGHSHEAIGEEERRRLQEDHDRFKAVLEARRVALREVEEERTRIETPEWVRALAEKRVEFDAGLVEATREGGVGDGEAVDTAAEMTSKALPVHGEVAPEAGPGPATTGNISRLEEAVDEEEIPEVWSTETGSRANIYDSFMNVMFKF